MSTDSSTEVRQAAELMAAHARIKALEADAVEYVQAIDELEAIEKKAAARIEALEAALREIEDCLDYVKDKGVV